MKRIDTITGLLALLTLATASAGTASALTGAADSADDVTFATPPPIVETFDYPGADEIFAERGIRLLKGDGGLVLTDCDTADPVIRVESLTLGTSCYQTVRGRGWITMEIPRVYVIQGDDHNVAAQLTAAGKTTSVDVSPGENVPVGEAVSDDPAVLVELHAS